MTIFYGVSFACEVTHLSNNKNHDHSHQKDISQLGKSAVSCFRGAEGSRKCFEPKSDTHT